MSRGSRAAALAILVGIAAAVGWWRFAPLQTPAPAPAAAEATAVVAEAVPVAPAPSAPPPAIPALPAMTPAALVVDTLRARADAGDMRAACRIAITLLDCRNVAFFAEAMARDASSDDAEPAAETTSAEERAREARQRDAIDAYALRMLDFHASCLALPADIRAREADYLTAAAHAGIPEAMLRYVDGHHLFIASSHDFIAHPGFDAWRRDAPAMLQRLFRSGNADSVMLLWMATSADYSPLAGLIPDDPEQALAYRHLMHRLRGSDERVPARGVDDATRARARALGDRWHQQYFGGRVRGPGPRDPYSSRLTPAWSSDQTVDRVPCND